MLFPLCSISLDLLDPFSLPAIPFLFGLIRLYEFVDPEHDQLAELPIDRGLPQLNVLEPAHQLPCFILDNMSSRAHPELIKHFLQSGWQSLIRSKLLWKDFIPIW